MRHIPRFYCPDDQLQAGSDVVLTDTAAHHARVVLRLRDGEEIRLFNARDGEWQGSSFFPNKKSVAVTLSTCLKDTEQLADIWLVLAPLKNKDAFDNAIRHAVELGVGRIVLVQTERTQASKINLDRLRQQIIDAAQQCGRLSVPDVTAPVSLKNLLAGWPTDRSVFACIEAADAVQPIGLAARNATACAVLIGPEGGFSENEKIWLMSRPHPALQPVSLGSLILRSDTAVAASLSACILKQ